MERGRELGTGRYLRLVEYRGWEYVEHLRATTIACAAAVTPRNTLLLVEQWRLPIAKFAVELPAGLTEPGETGAEAAARELLEETGYSGASSRLLVSGALSAGLSSCAMEIYEISDATEVEKSHGEAANERLTVLEVNLHEIHEYVAIFPHDTKCLDWRVLAAAQLLRAG